MCLTLNILVFISVPTNITLQNKYYVGRGKSVSLDCKVDGYPPPTITWTPCTPQVNVCNQSMLNISKVQNDGVYTCTAKNSLGNDSANTSLGKSFLFHVWQLSVHKMFASFRIDTIFSLPLMRELLHNFVKVLWINKTGIFLLLLWQNFIINERTEIKTWHFLVVGTT